jgi:transcriptional regulator with XRE-family HTH domain
VLPQHLAAEGGAMSEDGQEIAKQLFGRVLKHFRTQRGLSLRGLAKKALYDAGWLSKTENGEHIPTAATVQQIDRALNTGDLLLEMRNAIAAPGQTSIPISVMGGGPEDDAVMLDLTTPEGGRVRVRISRRDFNRLTAAGSLAAVFPSLTPNDTGRLAHTLQHPVRIDEKVLGYFRRILTEHFAADQSLGPRRLLRPVLAQIGVLDDLRKEAGPDHVDPLLDVLAQYAEMAGWLHQDLGRLDEAMTWSRRAGEWARCSGDDQMAAYMLVRQSNIAVLAGDHAGVVQYAAGARKTPDLDPKLLALASQQEARGHALRGQHDTATRLLSQATELLDDHPHVTRPGAPVYLTHYDQDTLHEQSAICLRLAGDISGATGILERKIAATPTGVIRDRGHLTAKLAVTLTYGTDPDPAHAAKLGIDALDAAHQTGSARIWKELAELDGQLLQHWPELPESRFLHEALTV